VTGASSGIGFDVTSCAEQEFDLLIAADRPSIHDAAQWLHPSRERGVDPRCLPRGTGKGRVSLAVKTDVMGAAVGALIIL
jgi:NAD(P)-dependent dehydrogenase (short-subunit alcohol dehydrogenase family)